MRRLLKTLIVLAALAPAAALAAGTFMTVKLREASVRSGPKHFKPVVATVRYGEQVEIVSRQKDWYEVLASGGVKGYLHETVVTDRPVAKIQGDSAGTGADRVSKDEIALAGKGFNPQVEGQYRQDNPDLAEAFRKVDAMERREVGREELERFLSEGKLGDAGRAE